jgi:hypothetical protein
MHRPSRNVSGSAVRDRARPRAKFFQNRFPKKREPAAVRRAVAKHGSHNASTLAAYSITSLAEATSFAGTVRPSALAVLRLIANTYLVGACTGRSAGISPLRMRST